MHAIGDAVMNNSYTNSESVNYWFTQFYDGYCGQDETSSTFAESPDSAEDDFWSDFGDGGGPADKACDVEDCTNGEEFLFGGKVFTRCLLRMIQSATSSSNS